MLFLLLVGFFVLILHMHGIHYHPSADYYRFVGAYEVIHATEEENRALVVGMWQLEIPYNASFDIDQDGWKKTRLNILPDDTFVLTDPPEYFEYLDGFRGTLKGQWEIKPRHWSDPPQIPLVIFYTSDESYRSGENIPSLGAMRLWTLRWNDTDKKYLRFFPESGSSDDYVPPLCPVWKRVVDK